MEALIIVGLIVGLPLIYYGSAVPKYTFTDPVDAKPVDKEEAHEEISSERFNAKLRQEKILDAMSMEEKKLFLRSSGYISSNPLPQDDDDFIKFVNICMTIVLLISVGILIYYLNTNTLPSFSLKLEL